MSGPPECEGRGLARQPARQALLDLLGANPDRGAVEPDDWPAILALASGGIEPILALEAERRGMAIPAAVRARLVQARQRSAAAALKRQAALRPAFAALDRAGIPFIVLKGLALAYRVYPTPETRTMNDVDLWVEASALDDATNALEAEGWRAPWWRDETGPAAGEQCLQYRDSRVLIELHYPPKSISDLMADGGASLWSARVPASLGWAEACVLPPEETLLHLSLHLAEHHRFINALGRLLDVTLVLRKSAADIDWPAFAQRCASLEASGWVGVTLGTARRMFGAPVPADALASFGIADLDDLCMVAEEQAWLRPR
ncbi:MAG TPA: nucleotidyltransferase family protein, partial [Gemmatimonadales bacterium]